MMLEGRINYFKNLQLLDQAKALIPNSKEDLLKTLSNVDKKTAMAVGVVALTAFALIGGAVYACRLYNKSSAQNRTDEESVRILAEMGIQDTAVDTSYGFDERAENIKSLAEMGLNAATGDTSAFGNVSQEFMLESLFSRIAVDTTKNEPARRRGTRVTHNNGTFEVAFSNRGKAFVSINEKNQIVMHTNQDPKDVVLIDEKQIKNDENIAILNGYLSKSK
ncbi:MAG: hypothetical protein SNF33_04940 [Candidatus Algichlamydia australiensis]|nr:hypothetical protein [Chlamydiales bacterium]